MLDKRRDIETMEREFAEELIAVLEAVQVQQLKLLSSAITEQEQKYLADIELATQESEMLEISRLEAEEWCGGFEADSAIAEQEQKYHEDLELATQESEIVEVSRLEAEQRFEADSAIAEQERKFRVALELATQESEIVEVSRLEAEERLKEIEEDMVAELLIFTRFEDEGA